VSHFETCMAAGKKIYQIYVGSLDGHLTATIHGTEQDLRDFTDLIAILENKIGRLVFNEFPTRVEVCHAMVGQFDDLCAGQVGSI
jgi:2,5-dioxopentanoate dehydrogenase